MYIASLGFLSKENDIGFWKWEYTFRDKYGEEGYGSVSSFSVQK